MCYNRPAMTREITQRELRNDSGEIMRRLDRGETFVVTRNGVPVGQLSPLRRRRFLAAEAAVAVFVGAPSVNARLLRRDLDRIAGQAIRPRG
jgi:prevent-host-death family protein